MTSAAESHPETDLIISRVLAAPRAALWRAWTEPELLRQWWCPRPWTTEVRAFELRAGGAFHTFMQGPEGGTSDNPGCFVEIVPQQRLVFTSMLGGGWRPQTPWLGFTAAITFADEGRAAATPRRSCTRTRQSVTNTSRWAFSMAGTWPSTSCRRWRPGCKEPGSEPGVRSLCAGKGL